MRDPYLYDGSTVLKNKLDIRDQDTLEGAEANYVSLRLKDIALHPLKGDYHTPHLLKMHEVIFQDLYEWAGSIRTISIYKEEGVLHGYGKYIHLGKEIPEQSSHFAANLLMKPATH